jgi:hypothetical protein
MPDDVQNSCSRRRLLLSRPPYAVRFRPYPIGCQGGCVLRLPDRDRSRAVLIGSARSGRPDTPAVRYALPALADTLADRRLCGLAPTNVRLVLDPDRPELARLDLEQCAGHATDVLLVYLAGPLLAGADGEPELAVGRSAGLPLGWVARTLSTSRAAIRLLVVDGLLAGADPELVRRRCASAVDTTALVVLSAPAHYAPPGRTGTALSRPLLDLAFRRDRGYLLRPVDLADALAPLLGGRLSYLEPPQPAPLALLRSPVGQPPVPADLRRLERQGELADDAERLAHRPGVLADRYRVLAEVAHRVHGPDHAETLRLRHRLAHWTGKSGDVEAAVALYSELHADRRRLLGTEHPHTRGSAADLDYWSAQARPPRAAAPR